MTVVVDLDDTLFKRTRFSKFCFKLANKIFLLGLRSERIDRTLKRRLILDYDRIIILSGRADDWMKTVTLKQLKKHHIPANSVLLCPRGELYLRWKKEQVEKLREKYPDLVWEDNDI